MTQHDRQIGNSTSAQLKDDINAGRTRDKVAAFDPAAAPLGTDEEAAGTPTPPQAWSEARRQEARAHPADEGPPAPWIVGLSGLVLAGAAIGWVIVELT
jgi:hypothetical protein